MSRSSSNAGIRSYRKTASLIVGSSLLFGTGAQASDLAATPVSAEAEASGASTIPATAAATAAADTGETGDPIVITGEKYRINTLNSRLPDVRDVLARLPPSPAEGRGDARRDAGDRA